MYYLFLLYIKPIFTEHLANFMGHLWQTNKLLLLIEFYDIGTVID